MGPLVQGLPEKIERVRVMNHKLFRTKDLYSIKYNTTVIGDDTKDGDSPQDRASCQDRRDYGARWHQSGRGRSSHWGPAKQCEQGYAQEYDSDSRFTNQDVRCGWFEGGLKNTKTKRLGAGL